MVRKVLRIDESVRGSGPSGPLPFSDFTSDQNLILLGDPGAGKSHLFRETAAAEDAKFVTTRTFLVTPTARLKGQVLYIDGLDERRAGRGDRDTIDSLVEKLFEVEPKKVRISCRVADWLGETDLAALHPYFETGGAPVVLLLERLSTEEQHAVLMAEGLALADATAFVTQAGERGLKEFLENPQNLLMLFRAVQSGTWPATRCELFDTATALMLREADTSRARSGTGVFTSEELAPVAGSVFAARLISDVEAISLSEQDGTSDIPGYRSIAFYDPRLVLATLGRRVFVAASAPESVDYAHRTTAEYLAAKWLSERVRAGLPLERVMALIGVDGVPAPELRGLHAWLAVHLSEHVEHLIDADPYGVLTYGDVAALSSTACRHLLKALARLSQKDPWFRSGASQSQLPSIGGLAREDMEDEFRLILRSSDGAAGMPSLVVDVLGAGRPLVGMTPDLADILVREAAPLVLRSRALKALLRMGGVGAAAIVSACATDLRGSVNSLVIRASAVTSLYGRPFGPDDVIGIVNGWLGVQDRTNRATLWGLADVAPLDDLPAILDGVRTIPVEGSDDNRSEWEVASFFTQTLIRVWKSDRPFGPARALSWLRTRHHYAEGYSGATDELSALINSTPERMSAIADIFLRDFVADENRWLKWNELRELSLGQLQQREQLRLVLKHLLAEGPATQKEAFLYELAFSLTYSSPNSASDFEFLYNRPSSHPHLLAVRDASVITKLPKDYFRWKLRRKEQEEQNDLEAQRIAFANSADSIRNGMHLGWLSWAARIYFGLYSDADENAKPVERLNDILGKANVLTAIAGLEAALQREDVPTFNEMIARIVARDAPAWWRALIAGLNERWQRRPDLEGLSQDFLRALIAFDLVHPTSIVEDGVSSWIVPPWKLHLLAHQPNLVGEACLAVARARLTAGDQHAEGLHDLLTDAAFEPIRADVIAELLRDFPNADPFRLDELIRGALKLPESHHMFLKLAAGVLAHDVVVGQHQRDLWLTAAYMLAPNTYQVEVELEARARPSLVFALRDRSGFERHNKPGENALSIGQLEFMARLTGTLYPSMHPPSGWSGDTNPWDASEHFRKMTAMISAIPTQAATDALTRLNVDVGLSSYSESLRHDLANQQQLRRDAEYDRPDWGRTIKSLQNGAPATVADLHALLVDHFREVRKHIERDNADIFKLFWNLDQWSRPSGPRPEEACRDFLVVLLRPQLAPFGITVEPEGHMVGDRRADVSAAMPSKKILCELKRDYHADVWTAAEGQLDRFYAHDPEAKGYGIYCVFWFGDSRPSPLPKPPKSLDRPSSAAEMESMLRGLLPEAARNRLAIIVIDVSGAEGS